MMRLSLALGLCCLCTFAFATDPAHASIRKDLNVAPEPLGAALQEIAKTYDFQLLYHTEIVQGLKSKGVTGSFTPDDALTQVLEGTGLAFKYLDGNTVTVFSRESSGSPADSPRSDSQATSQDTGGNGKKSSDTFRVAQANTGPEVASDSTPKKDERLTEIVVTGTHIRGAVPVGSSVSSYSRSDIDQSGAGTISDFARQIGDNFSSVDLIATGTSSASRGQLNAGTIDNAYYGAAFNLHGLGTTSTLTLLNGHRLAPAGQTGLITDTSQIPLSAVDHIDVLSDGASAIYGADAVAGVVNIVTRRDFDGAQTSLRYGASTNGGAAEFTGSQLLGHSWSDGNVLVVYEFDHQLGLDASERDYIPSQGGPDSLLPRNERNSLFLSVNQGLWSGATLAIDGIYGERNFDANFSEVSAPLDLTLLTISPGSVKQYGGSATLDTELWRDWHGGIDFNYSRLDQTSLSTTNEVFEGFPSNAQSYGDTISQLYEVSPFLNGSALFLPGGAVKAAIGGDFRTEKLEQFGTETFAGTTSSFGIPPMQRHVASAYAELFVPVIGENNAAPWTRRLDLSAAVRYDRYSDFGSTTNPRFGVTWEPTIGVTMRATYGKSFRAPALGELGGQIFSDTTLVPYTAAPTGVIDTLDVVGGNPNLRPETAKTYTLGIDFAPALIRNFKASATYFHTVYNNRIASPLGTLALSPDNPILLPFFEFSPPLSVVNGYFKSPGFGGDGVGNGPGGVQAIFDNQNTNIATQRQSGLDFSAEYKVSTDRSDQFSISARGTHIFQNEYQPITGLPPFSLLNTFAQPVSWRAVGNVGWSMMGFSALATANYVTHYENNQFVPSVPIASWTTFDLNLRYDTQDGSHYLPAHFTIDLAILNIANREPPYVGCSPLACNPGVTPPPFDSTNASPVGRLIAVQVSKAWR